MYIKEACVETIEESLKAEELGADRLEYCSRLDLDGLTPDITEVKKALELISIPIVVMIRPRGGNFEYTSEEFEIMKQQLLDFKKIGIAGIVFGINVGQCVDIERSKIIAELAAPLEVCFHKAIDEVNDIIDATKQLSQIPQITRILTSGKKATAIEGLETLRKMIEAADGDLSILAAGKIRPDNIDLLHQKLQAKEYHGRGIVG